mgnify:CR=1 FL=1
MLIKANHYANVTDVTLKRVSLDSAEEPSTSDNSTTSAGSSVSLSSDFALTVEMCQCPPNYAGTSCEVRFIVIFEKVLLLNGRIYCHEVMPESESFYQYCMKLSCT